MIWAIPLCFTSLQLHVLPIYHGRSRIILLRFLISTIGYYFSGKVSNVSR